MKRKPIIFFFLIGILSSLYSCLSTNPQKRLTERKNAPQSRSFHITEKSDKYLRLEDFGDQAYTKPFYGRKENNMQYPLIAFAPYSVDNHILFKIRLKGTNYTLISAESESSVFTCQGMCEALKPFTT